MRYRPQGIDEKAGQIACDFCMSAVGGDIDRINGGIKILKDVLLQFFDAGGQDAEACEGVAPEVDFTAIRLNYELQHGKAAVLSPTPPAAAPSSADPKKGP